MNLVSLPILHGWIKYADDKPINAVSVCMSLKLYNRFCGYFQISLG